MRLYLRYGAFLALGAFLLNVLLYLLNFHSDPEKLQAAQWIYGLGRLAISVTVLALGIRAQRDLAAPGAEFSYGTAVGAGVKITLWASLFRPFFDYLYFGVINPGFQQVLLDAQTAKLEARGLSADQIERAQRIMRLFTSPGAEVAFGLIGGLLGGVVLSVLIAAFLRREGKLESAPAA